MHLILIPTYQGALSVRGLPDRALEVPALALADLHVFLVDGASPDGTAPSVATHPADLPRTVADLDQAVPISPASDGSVA